MRSTTNQEELATYLERLDWIPDVRIINVVVQNQTINIEAVFQSDEKVFYSHKEKVQLEYSGNFVQDIDNVIEKLEDVSDAIYDKEEIKKVLKNKK